MAKFKGTKMTTTAQEPEVTQEPTVTEQPEVTEAPVTTAAPATTVPPTTTPAPTAAPVQKVASGVVVANTAAPAGKEASKTVVASITSQTTQVTEPAKTAFEKRLDKVMAEGSGREKNVVSAMRTYIETMKPGRPTSPQEGSAAQAALFRLFTTVVRHDEFFKECMDIMVAFFREYKDSTLHEHYAFRFTEYMTLSSEQIKAFTYMVNMLKIAAQMTNKKDVLKSVDLNRTMNEAYSEDQRQRVISYFS